jgi:hypothetical protein
MRIALDQIPLGLHMQAHRLGHQGPPQRLNEVGPDQLVLVVVARKRRGVTRLTQKMAQVMQPTGQLQVRTGLGIQGELAALPGVGQMNHRLARIGHMAVAAVELNEVLRGGGKQVCHGRARWVE